MFSRLSQQRFPHLGDPTRMQKVLALVIEFQWWILLAVCVFAAGYHYSRPLPSHETAMAEIKRLTKVQAALQEKRQKVLRRIAWLQDKDSGYRELVAKDKLGWQAEGEVTVRLEPATR